ncbi:Inner membrane protein YbaN [Pseudoruegeria aquimaris]|uniref:Inner membrane protein YbaN n=1 Tax=Pseudoruegeria aquimaris TaxID=393663 RepID=A0A1Y5RTI9_9RHOB|nr:YbaN family protein [Pseudoruegeria aquimaris]SLN24666.1 Inner membrane protein YbaN [Pseudoruegeria aquimaris]
MRYLWLCLGIIALGLGAIGILLPLLPTVPFLLLAAFFFARSSERLHNWLIAHPRFGPPIEDWNRSGAIGRGAKKLATLSIGAAFGLSLLLGVRPMILMIQAATLLCVLLFIWTRPES